MSKRMIPFLALVLLVPAAASAQQTGRGGFTPPEIEEYKKKMAEKEAQEAAKNAPKSVADTIAGHKRLTTLAAAVDAAGLTETLGSDDKEFTVFAPNDGAFKKLPDGTVDSLLKPESKDKLTGILTFHVVDGTKMAADVASADGGLKTLQGGTLVFKDGMIGTEDNMVKVITKDIECTNGVVHIITGVLMPGE